MDKHDKSADFHVGSDSHSDNSKPEEKMVRTIPATEFEKSMKKISAMHAGLFKKLAQ